MIFNQTDVFNFRYFLPTVLQGFSENIGENFREKLKMFGLVWKIELHGCHIRER